MQDSVIERTTEMQLYKVCKGCVRYDSNRVKFELPTMSISLVEKLPNIT